MKKLFTTLLLGAAPILGRCAEGVLLGVPHLSEKNRALVVSTIVNAGGKIAGYCEDHKVFVVENADGQAIVKALAEKDVVAYVKIGTPQELKENCQNFIK
ncbi:MAG: hypothetical protein RMM53_01895 [Bacteroidia bacterium]|nr:hypothetical protein [Bacteroidia bacterium]MDW8332946.1 hypothetical protein [Bacteroidia bacterium]